jgi:hypothetical protein
MPRIFQLPELENANDGEQIMCVKGKIKSIFKANRGDGDKGPWSFQDFKMTDAKGKNEVTCTVNNWEEDLDPKLKGKFVAILSTQSAKGWHGVKVKYDEFKKKNVIWITQAAELSPIKNLDEDPQGEPEGGQEEPEEPKQPPQRQQRAASEPPPQRQAPAQQSAPASQPAPAPARQDEYDEAEGLKKAREGLGKATNLVLLSLKAADYVATEYKGSTGKDLTPELFGQVTMAILITARDKFGAHMYLPKGKIKTNEEIRAEWAKKKQQQAAKLLEEAKKLEAEAAKAQPQKTPAQEEEPKFDDDSDVPF